MAQVKIIKGAYGHRPEGKHYIHTALTGEVVDVSNAEADRLVSIGVATYIEKECEASSGDAIAIPVYSIDMKADQLRALMEQENLPLKAGMTKADMVAALDENFTSVDDSDALPEPSAENPVT